MSFSSTGPRLLLSRNYCINLARSSFSGYSTKAERQASRQKIYKEIKDGAFADLHEYRKTGGKRYTAQETLLGKADARGFPKLSGISLAGETVHLHDELKGNTSLVLLWLKALGQTMCDPYRAHFTAAFDGMPNVKMFEVSVVEGLLYRLFKTRMISSTKATVKPESRHKTFLFHFGSGGSIRETILENEIVGHCYLVDRDGLIRWKAHALPLPDELESLKRCTELLIKENFTR